MKPHSVIAVIATLSIGIAYTSSFASVSAPSQDPPGKAPYEDNCRKCHGVRGVAPKTMKAKYEKIATFDAAFFEKHSKDSIVTILTKGKNENMKSFKAKLSTAEMVAVASYIRSLPVK